MACPSSQTYQDFGCGVIRCCDSVSCVVNVSGPCVCAAYFESTDHGVSNYSFIANCAYDSVTGTSLGAACFSTFGPLAQEPYTCYCRPRTSGDVGSLGDQEDGNSIFPWNGGCGYFGDSDTSAATTPAPPGTTTPADTPTPASSTGGSASSNLAVRQVPTFEVCLLVFVLVAVWRRVV